MYAINRGFISPSRWVLRPLRSSRWRPAASNRLVSDFDSRRLPGLSRAPVRASVVMGELEDVKLEPGAVVERATVVPWQLRRPPLR